MSVENAPGSGSLVLNFDISGSHSADATGPVPTAAGAGVSLINFDVSFPQFNRLTSTIHPPESFQFLSPWTVVIPYSSSSFLFGLDLAISSQSNSACNNTTPGGVSTCTADVDAAFGSTFLLSSVQLLDDSGQLLPDAFLLGDSIRYNNQPATTAPAPEPATWLLVGSGLVGLLRRRHAR